MGFSRFGLLTFSFMNGATFSLEPDGPVPFLWRNIFSNIPKPQNPHASFSSKTVLITGGNSGVGFAAAKQLAGFGAHVIITARSAARGNTALQSLRDAVPGAKIDLMALDMASFASVREFAKEIIANVPKLDMAILNAGAYHFNYEVSSETGYEMTTQVHVLSTCLLSLLLVPLLERSSQDDIPSRLLIIISEAHNWVSPYHDTPTGIFEKLNSPKSSYGPYIRYHTTKMLMTLWTKELASRINSNKVLAGLASPGFCSTGLFRASKGQILASIIDKIFARTAGEGADTYLLALEAPKEEFHAKYWSVGRIMQTSRFTRSEKGAKLQKELWPFVMEIVKKESPELESSRF